MREHSRYHFKGIPGTYPADPPGVETVCYEFDTEAEMNESGLLNDKRRTSCYTSNGKFYIAGHFTETQTYQNGLSKTCRYRDNSMHPVCYFGGKAVYIKSCVGCYEDGRNTKAGADATAFAER